MKLNALLMCRQHESLSVLLNTLEDLSIDGEMCSSAADAMELLALGYYSALIVDFDLPGASQAVHMGDWLRHSAVPSCLRSSARALISEVHFRRGQLVLYNLWSSNR